MCNCRALVSVLFILFPLSSIKVLLLSFCVVKNQIRLGTSNHRPSGWNKLQLQSALFFIGFIILVTFLVKIVTDRAWKPNFCRKTRSDMTKGWHNIQDTDFYCIWCLFRHVWHVCFHASSPLIAAVLWWDIMSSISSLFYSSHQSEKKNLPT